MRAPRPGTETSASGILSPQRTIAVNTPEWWPLERARIMMVTRPGETLSVAALARLAHLSPYHFIRRFRQTYGDTPHRYLVRQRMLRAKQLLVTTEISVTDVALEVGFESLGTFTTAFTRMLGHPPGRYRRRIYPALGLPKALVPWCFFQRYGGVGEV